ncbi:MAG: ABC transporter permease [Opitutaceae bacterium]
MRFVFLIQELKHALRRLAKSPGFTAVAVLSLALGTGANTAIFSAISALTLRSLPVVAPHELRVVNWVGANPRLNSYTGGGMEKTAGGLVMAGSFTYPTYLRFRDHAAGLADIFAFSPISEISFRGRGEPYTTGAMLVSGNFFGAYGAQTLTGRPLAAENDQPGAPPSAVITHRCWEKHFGLDPQALGQAVTINGHSFTIIGILPRHFAGPLPGDPADVYVPISTQPQLTPDMLLVAPDHWWVNIMARLAPGADEARVQAAIEVQFKRVVHDSNMKINQPGVRLRNGRQGVALMGQGMTRPLYALLAVVSVILLIACANLASLLLARSAARQHELAVRAALGESRWRLIWHSLTEALLLAFAGGALGLFVADWINHVLVGYLISLRGDLHVDLRIDFNVLAFTVGVTALAALACGLLPALRAWGVDPIEGLKSQSALGAPRLRLGKALIAIQVGLSVLLVLIASLLVQSFAKLRQVNPGFNAENVLLFRVNPVSAGCKGQELAAFYDDALRSLAVIPGVRTVALSSLALASGASNTAGIDIPGRPPKAGEVWQASELVVSEGFFVTMGIPLLLGREFAAGDMASSLPVVIVNEQFAQTFFPGSNPIGETFLNRRRTYSIIGVSRNVIHGSARRQISPAMHFSHRQRPPDRAYFEVKSAVPPLSLAPAIRKSLAEINANIPLSDLKTQQQQIDASILVDRLLATLGGALALLAVLLSCLGLGGLTAYNVARRRREIGVRMALGAQSRDVVYLFLREAFLLACIGVAVGLPAAIGLAIVVRRVFFEVQPYDPVTIVSSAAVLLAVAALAALVPARRAARTAPMIVLRAE